MSNLELKVIFYNDLFKSNLNFYIDLDNPLYISYHKLKRDSIQCNNTNCLFCDLWFPKHNTILCDIIMFDNSNNIYMNYVLYLNEKEFNKLNEDLVVKFKGLYLLKEANNPNYYMPILVKLKNNSKKYFNKKIKSYSTWLSLFNKLTEREWLVN